MWDWLPLPALNYSDRQNHRLIFSSLYLVSVDLILENARCSFGMEENISAQVAAFMGVVWNLLNSKRLYSCEVCWFYKRRMQIMDMSSFSSPKTCLQFPGKSRHYMQIEKNVSNSLHGFHTTTVTTAKRSSRNVTCWADTSDSGISRRQNHQNVENLNQILFILIALQSRQW